MTDDPDIVDSHREAVEMRMLSVDEGFVPSPVADGDELFPNGVFEFNITRILAYLANHPDGIVLESVAVGGLPRWRADLDEGHVAAADLARPLVLAEIAPGRYILIDGHHRLEKARLHGVDTLPAYRLRATQHLPFLTSMRAYRTFIEYWNGKLMESGGPRGTDIGAAGPTSGYRSGGS